MTPHPLPRGKPPKTGPASKTVTRRSWRGRADCPLTLTAGP
jgi:hypothetical protein